MRSARTAPALVSAGGEGAALTLAGARRALVEATQLRAVAGLVDRFAIIRHAAKKARLSLGQQNDWAVLKLEAERKAGQILGEMRETGRLRDGRPNGNDASAFGGPLAELGISAIQSSRWQRVALLSGPTSASGRRPSATLAEKSPRQDYSRSPRGWRPNERQRGMSITASGIAAQLGTASHPSRGPTAMACRATPSWSAIASSCCQP